MLPPYLKNHQLCPLTHMKFPRFLACLALLSLAPLAQAEVDFEKQILPLINKSCMDCHKAPYEKDGRTQKPKGGLRLDGAWAIMAGGEGGAAVVAGDVDASELHYRTTLPEDDDDFMPPKGTKWTQKEKDLVALWIKEGAKFGDWKGSLVGKPEETVKEEVYVSKTQVLYESLAKDLKAADKKNIEKVEQLGGRVTPLATGNPLLEVDYLVARNETTDEKIAGIGAIRDNLAHLELDNTQITDEALKYVSDLPRLTRLNLNNTKVTDAGIKHLTSLENLTYLNLYGTEVGDGAVKDLAKIKSLEKVFLWKTKVTDKGVKQLEKQLPEAQVVWK